MKLGIKLKVLSAEHETLGMEYFEGIGEAVLRSQARFHCPGRPRERVAAGTVQVDYNLPERFDLSTWQRMALQTPGDDSPRSVWVIERLIGILIEEYAGDFPRGWLPTSPVAASE